MGKFEKLFERFMSSPKDFEYRELVTLLARFGFQEMRKGKTSGSRAAFADAKKNVITLHKPHPEKFLKGYQIGEIIQQL